MYWDISDDVYNGKKNYQKPGNAVQTRKQSEQFQ